MMTGAATDQGLADEALVVFSGQTDLWWLHLLKPGFRHCFALLRFGEHWVLYNPLAQRTEMRLLTLQAPPETWYARHGLRVIRTRPRLPPKRALPWRPYTCVEAIKRALGLRAPWVLTPWQLYCALSTERRPSTASLANSALPRR